MIVGKGKLECIRCGCNIFKALEINHKNLGGTQENLRYLKNSDKLIHLIKDRKRKTNDLEITCRVCNSVHYLEKKYGICGFKVLWEG